ncbi:MAG: PEP/pyruvate-binding domain-containing protein [Eubacteriales bacterium]|nr:PEP/pyruvate-binding domain-containing protein [Eubacteriales bacterium]
MAAFERIHSGLPGLDLALDSIRLGDNVVWQIQSIADYQFVVKPFVAQAIAEHRNLVYVRFAQHKPLIAEQRGVKIYDLDPSRGFEDFTVRVHEIITQEGVATFYVFDCLSDLQEAWSTDLMMGNFFRVTCPYLFLLDTVAYFPLLRGMHSYEAVARIRETTQLLLDLFCTGNDYFLHPLKVWNRYSGEMFLPHRYDPETGHFPALTNGIAVGRFYKALDESGGNSEQNLDSWDRYFSLVKLQAAQGHWPHDAGATITSIMMTRDEKMDRLVRAHFSPRDFFLVRDRMIGTGLIGGKACGMLMARQLIRTYLPDLAVNLEPHDSYYIGSDVFYTYIVHNDCWNLRIQQRAERDKFTASVEFGHRLKQGRFPENIREQFRRMLDYFGQNPIIVRSSSFLEDGFGNAFAGKYESVFCTSCGDADERLAAFENAVKTVYASTMDPSALEYRRRRGLFERDEQMAILVQRVSGSRHGDLFMPMAAGVGFSYNAYPWMEGMDPGAGMLRLVMGLGTRAVDRTDGDYPRVIGLDRPSASPHATAASRHKYSQRLVDVIDLKNNLFSAKSLNELIPDLPNWYQRLVLSHDFEAESRLREQGRYQPVIFADCQGLVSNRDFIILMHQMLETLENHYGCPVDIEYAVNGSEQGDFAVNLLQCRPLHVDIAVAQEIPDVRDERVLFAIEDSSMGHSRQDRIDIVVVIDPMLYYAHPYNRKTAVSSKIGEINRYFSNQNQNLLLLVPGRIGTSSPELGVPVVYAEISQFTAVCEVSYSKTGYMPELSFGSHLFQDLVEAKIFYGAIFEDNRTRLFQPNLLNNFPNRYSEICTGDEDLSAMIGVYDVIGSGLTLFNDMIRRQAVCQFIGKNELPFT